MPDRHVNNVVNGLQGSKVLRLAATGKNSWGYVLPHVRDVAKY